MALTCQHLSGVILSAFLLVTSCILSDRANAVIICHGQTESVCKIHPYDRFEHCGNDNGVGGANPLISAQTFCPGGNHGYLATPTAGTIKDGYCGYSWFQLRCAKATYSVCHGEHRDGICSWHYFNVFEACGKSSRNKGANPSLSCTNLCGKALHQGCEVQRSVYPLPYDYCGYSWFEVLCF
jgi:hypothetical protein